MIDRRKDPREFFIAGWDPYVVELTAESRSSKSENAGPGDRVEEAPPRKPAITRWRTMVLRRIGRS